MSFSYAYACVLLNLLMFRIIVVHAGIIFFNMQSYSLVTQMSLIMSQ